jgi:hypothetical protein
MGGCTWLARRFFAADMEAALLMVVVCLFILIIQL